MKKLVLFLGLSIVSIKYTDAQNIMVITLDTEPFALLPHIPWVSDDELSPKRRSGLICIGCYGTYTPKPSIPTCAIQQVRVIVGGFPAEYEYGEPKNKQEKVPQRSLLPLTHRTYEEKYEWPQGYIPPTQYLMHYPFYF